MSAHVSALCRDWEIGQALSDSQFEEILRCIRCNIAHPPGAYYIGCPAEVIVWNFCEMVKRHPNPVDLDVVIRDYVAATENRDTLFALFQRISKELA